MTNLFIRNPSEDTIFRYWNHNRLMLRVINKSTWALVSFWAVLIFSSWSESSLVQSILRFLPRFFRLYSRHASFKWRTVYWIAVRVLIFWLTFVVIMKSPAKFGVYPPLIGWEMFNFKTALKFVQYNNFLSYVSTKPLFTWKFGPKSYIMFVENVNGWGVRALPWRYKHSATFSLPLPTLKYRW